MFDVATQFMVQLIDLIPGVIGIYLSILFSNACNCL